eukprot:CAMPEP_0172543428 /NCGR_PEP_ID=MMETSP1067-20121228/13837_1 /TAXON_ID=265564 ORGANISM="Thalassiosira punctigera, Strain Tpunct2005C2" /NCGR_SAMPLE_ID=MMETSP1067 /ASSEMBLY_ACC=CAM_ASM_000444 /LENGTH=261 /DNA_ID=CAMNT_0013329851 /DNA_START=112 /DNA_END=897 /DNA_ORIENTATION=-
MAFSPMSAASARTTSVLVSVSRRLPSHSFSLAKVAVSTSTSECPFSSNDTISSALALATGNVSNLAHQTRLISSLGRPHSSEFSASTSFAPPTYSALRNKATLPHEIKPGKPYASPHSDFFSNIEAGRTSLGTTEEIEQRAFELQEQHLECGIPESELRFQTKSYGRFALPPYVSPGEHRVTVKVALSAIPFENEQEKEVFFEIVGSRFNPKKGVLQLSSEKFASRIENKRHLVDMIERIVLSCRKLAKEFDADDETSTAS